MKIKTYLGLALCMAGGLVSCNDDYLDQTVITDLNEDVIFADSTYASGFLTQIYTDIGFDTDGDRFGGHNTLWSNGGLQVACDEAEFRPSASITTGMAFATGTVNPVTVTDDAWKTCYADIRACNKFLSRIADTPMLESTRQQYIAECRFLRAWYYYVLVRHYGGVPLLGDVLYGPDDEVKYDRDTYEACIKYIADEVNAVLAMNVLRPRTSGSTNGRINEACCYGLLSRMYLDAASPLHNGSGFGTEDTKDLLGYPTYDKERWLRSIEASRRIMTMTAGDYRLYEVHADSDNNNEAEPGWGYYAVQIAADFANVTSYGDFEYPYGAYQEIILQKKEPEGIRVCDLYCPPSCGGDRLGGYIYYDLAAAFPMADGKAVDDPTGKYQYNPLDPKTNRDPRFGNTVTVNNMQQMSAGDKTHWVYTCIGDGATEDAIYSGTPTGLYIKKMVHRNCAGNYFVEPPMSRPLIRFAEILLNYAEATNEYYGPDYSETFGATNIGPLEVLKLIRRRAGIEAGADGMYGLKANMTQEEMREAIRLERRLELCFEGFRFFDVRRWMIAEETDNATMHGLELTHTGTNMRTGYTWRVVDVRKHIFRKAMYFWPIPYDEIVKLPGLKQNPYY
ncbi:MAG: RagB/SusD family nutrient uptake outer membrane protein [Prevotella sp.]|nr:RagB/SusD family nutrient uptake outer membrane protein [Prevotella sp.]